MNHKNPRLTARHRRAVLHSAELCQNAVELIEVMIEIKH